MDVLTGILDGTCWRDVLVGRFGGTFWWEVLVVRVGGTCWWDVLVGRFDGTSWLDVLTGILAGCLTLLNSADVMCMTITGRCKFSVHPSISTVNMLHVI